MNDEPIFTPSQFIDYIARNRGLKRSMLKIPPRVVMLYDREGLRYLHTFTKSKAIKWWYDGKGSLQTGRYRSRTVSLIRNLIGSPAAAMLLEEIIATGAKEIIEVGIAGGIQPYLSPGDILVVTNAKRDEGTSYHYLAPNVELECSHDLRERIEDHFNEQHLEYHRGAVWTTDGVYRETKAKLRKFRKEGALGVNMETTALLAVARHRNVKLASIQVISDILSESGWLLAVDTEEVRASMRHAMKCALEAICSH